MTFGILWILFLGIPCCLQLVMTYGKAQSLKLFPQDIPFKVIPLFLTVDGSL